MTTTSSRRPPLREVPKTREARVELYGEGPWIDEPDELRFEVLNMPCLMIRTPDGKWCGYVAVPPGHPLHGVGSYEELDEHVRAHGGITYAKACAGHVCHVPKPGEPDDVWWIGFDCAHGGDLVPAHENIGRKTMPGLYSKRDALAAAYDMHDQYRDVDYVKTEVAALAAQLAFIGEQATADQ